MKGVSMLLLLLSVVTLSALSNDVNPALRQLLDNTSTPSNNSTNWAILVAGSNTYYNYRHQADICHMYQILTKTGKFPEDNIIVMMYDDIAFNDQNPVKGNIINHVNGPNVFTGLKNNIDYKGEACSSQNFLDAIMGKKTHKNKGKKTFAGAGPNDNIFMFFADHGATRIVVMPDNGMSDEIHAADWFAAIVHMHKNKMYREMVIYVEACESGSMFAQYSKELKHMNVYAQTAANPDESSYACYWDDKRQTYLGDVYSVNTMEYMDKYLRGTCKDTSKDIEEEFEKVRTETNTSHVQQYGAIDTLGKENICQFMDFDEPRNRTKKQASHSEEFKTNIHRGDVVNSRDVVLATLEKRYMMTNSRELAKRLLVLIQKEKRHRHSSMVAFMAIAKAVRNDDAIASYFESAKELHKLRPDVDVCHRAAYKATIKKCGGFSDYNLQFVKVLWNLCLEYDLEQVLAGITKGCAQTGGFAQSVSFEPLPTM